METFRLIEHFSQLIEQVRSQILFRKYSLDFFQAGLDMERRYLVANKIDLIEHRQVDEELGQRVRGSLINYSLKYSFSL